MGAKVSLFFTPPKYSMYFFACYYIFHMLLLVLHMYNRAFFVFLRN